MTQRASMSVSAGIGCETMGEKKALQKQGFYSSNRLRLYFGVASGLASGLASGFASGFFAGGFGCTPTASTVTRRFGARHSISCLRFILLSQNFVTGIGCLNALPSQKISF